MTRLLLAGYLGIGALVFFSQEQLLFPGSSTQGKPAAEFRPAPDTELLSFTTQRGDRNAALFGQATRPDDRLLPDAAHRPTLILFYGNGTWLKEARHTFRKLRRLGFNVLVPEYTGYGLSAGRVGEPGFYATADAAYDYLLMRKDVDPRRIVAFGYSLGGAVAIDLASRRPVCGVVAINTFTSMVEMAGLQFPWLPTGLLLRHRFESERKIAKVQCPVWIGNGTLDLLVPPVMANRLASAAGGPVTRVTVAEADHNNFFGEGGAAIYSQLQAWIGTLPTTTVPSWHE